MIRWGAPKSGELRPTVRVLWGRRCISCKALTESVTNFLRHVFQTLGC